MNKWGVAILTGVVLIATIITSIIIQKSGDINAWKKDRIKSVFYDTITQEDIAWG